MTPGYALEVVSEQRNPAPQRALRAERRRKLKLCRVEPPHTRSLSSEQQALVTRYRAECIRLALSMLRRWKCRIERDELQSIVDVAVCDAASRFEPTRGVAFMTFLYYHLKGNLVKSIRTRSDRTTVLIDDLGRSGEWSDATGREYYTEDSFAYASRTAEPLISEEILYERQLLKLCRQVCESLVGAERDVILRTYFDGDDMDKVMAATGYSRGHICRIKKGALAKVRRRVEAQTR